MAPLKKLCAQYNTNRGLHATQKRNKNNWGATKMQKTKERCASLGHTALSVANILKK